MDESTKLKLIKLDMLFKLSDFISNIIYLINISEARGLYRIILILNQINNFEYSINQLN